MARIIRHKEILGAFAVILFFGLLFVWGQGFRGQNQPCGG